MDSLRNYIDTPSCTLRTEHRNIIMLQVTYKELNLVKKFASHVKQSNSTFATLSSVASVAFTVFLSCLITWLTTDNNHSIIALIGVGALCISGCVGCFCIIQNRARSRKKQDLDDLIDGIIEDHWTNK